MHPDDDHRAVEFVVPEPDGGVDEDLVQPEGFPRLRRARLPLFVAGAIGLLALVVVTVVNGPSGSPSAARTTVTTSPSTTSTSPSPSTTSPSPSEDPTARSGSVVLHFPAIRRTVVLPQVSCPVGASCAVLFDTSKSIAAAVHAALPRTTRLRTVTTIERDAPATDLQLRHITGRFAAARVSIRVEPANAADRIGWTASENAMRTQVTATRHVDSLLVTVRVTAPPGFDIDIAAVRRLAADPRLTRIA